VFFGRLDRRQSFRKTEHGKFDEESAAVREGRLPEFGSNVFQ
jgi:hypothetical protein